MSDKVYPIGKVFKYEDVWLRVEADNGECKRCYFYRDDILHCLGDSDHHPPCDSLSREGDPCIFVAVPEPEKEAAEEVAVGGMRSVPSGLIVEAVKRNEPCVKGDGCCLIYHSDDCMAVKCVSGGPDGERVCYREVKEYAEKPLDVPVGESVTLESGQVVRAVVDSAMSCIRCCVTKDSDDCLRFICNMHERLDGQPAGFREVTPAPEPKKSAVLASDFRKWWLSTGEKIRVPANTSFRGDYRMFARAGWVARSRRVPADETNVPELRKQLDRVQTQYDAAIQSHSATEAGWEKQIDDTESRVRAEVIAYVEEIPEATGADDESKEHALGRILLFLYAPKDAENTLTAAIEARVRASFVASEQSLMKVTTRLVEECREVNEKYEGVVRAASAGVGKAEARGVAGANTKFAEKVRELRPVPKVGGGIKGAERFAKGQLCDKLLEYLDSPESVDAEAEVGAAAHMWDNASVVALLESLTDDACREWDFELSSSVLKAMGDVHRYVAKAEARGRHNLEMERGCIMGGLMIDQAEKHQVELKEAESRGVAKGKAEVVEFVREWVKSPMNAGFLPENIYRKFSPEPEPTMNHQQAMTAVLVGVTTECRRVSEHRAHIWYSDSAHRITSEYPNGKEDIDATDWIIVKEN